MFRLQMFSFLLFIRWLHIFWISFNPHFPAIYFTEKHVFQNTFIFITLENNTCNQKTCLVLQLYKSERYFHSKVVHAESPDGYFLSTITWQLIWGIALRWTVEGLVFDPSDIIRKLVNPWHFLENRMRVVTSHYLKNVCII